jgi:predicted AlkP superfamily pyrophosphatase or phosphodiesterase
MSAFLRSAGARLVVCLSLAVACLGSAYNARPKLVVVVVIDQFPEDYLERYREQFGQGGFRLFLDHGALFANCNYDYADTRTAPGHATLFTGAYANGHGILANEWWDPQKKRVVTSVQDDATRLVGVASTGPGSSPHNLLADTLGDELKLATQSKSRVFGIALKDRAAILPIGYSGDGSYWIDPKSGVWVTSTYYRSELPKWVQDFNAGKRAEKYVGLEWKDANGKLLRTTAPSAGKPASFFELVGSTPFANDYEFDFARELIINERLGTAAATDLLVVSLSANDILGHKAGPDSPEVEAMTLATDRQLADFFTFLGQQLGLANVWLALSADHGIAPLPAVASSLRIPAANLDSDKMRADLNRILSARFSPAHPVEYVKYFDYPMVWLDDVQFSAVKASEADAEHAAGEALKQIGLRDYYTRSQLAEGAVPNTETGRQYLHSYSPLGGWYVLGVPAPFTVGVEKGTDHATGYTYDTHVPLAFYGLPFQPGTYRKHAEPVDLAVTLASLLEIHAPTHAIGRVLTEALAPPSHAGSGHPAARTPGATQPSTTPADDPQPGALADAAGGKQ